MRLEERDELYKLLEGRARRLCDLARLRAPTLMVAAEAWLVVKAAFTLAPQELGKIMALGVQRWLRIDMDRCEVCGEDTPGRDITRDYATCKPCVDRIAKEMEQLDAEVLLAEIDEATRGGNGQAEP